MEHQNIQKAVELVNEQSSQANIIHGIGIEHTTAPVIHGIVQIWPLKHICKFAKKVNFLLNLFFSNLSNMKVPSSVVTV